MSTRFEIDGAVVQLASAHSTVLLVQFIFRLDIQIFSYLKNVRF